MTSLSLIFPLLDQWGQLRDGTRDAIIGGLVVAIVIGLAAIFRKTLLGVLRHLLGIAPHEITVKLESVQPVGQQPAKTPATVPISQSPEIPRPPITGFVARRDKDGRDIVARLRDELAPERNQLVVLWGAGGVGKTTLATETARLLNKKSGAPIIWVSAEGRTDFSLSTLLDEIATHLGRADLRQLVLEQKDKEVHTALASSLAMLIVLDNFETILPEEQDKCADWLAKRANVPALITSRDEVIHARPINILAMSMVEAREFLQILIQQARNPKAFDGIDHEEIIKAADRIPLVLQWVVKRIDSARQPKVVISDLTHGEGDAAKRVFDRSFDLPQVGNDGRDVLLALSLFVPSASRAGLAEVAGFGNDTTRLERALQQLAELWLIETIQSNERVSVEGLTRELTKARLIRENLADAFRKRFVTYFVNFAKAHSKPSVQDYEVLESEKENLISAMDTAFRQTDWNGTREIAYVMMSPPNGVLYVHGYWDEAIRAGELAIEAAQTSGNESSVATFLGSLALIRQAQGDYGEARKALERVLVVFRKLKNDANVGAALHGLGILAQNEGKLQEARQFYNDALEMAKKSGDEHAVASGLHQLGNLAQDQGEFEEARALYIESLEIEKKLDNQNGVSSSLHQLGRLAQTQGEIGKARTLYEESLELSKKLGDQNGIAISFGQLGNLAEEEGNYVEATQFAERALTIFERLGSPGAEKARSNLERLRAKS